MSSEKLNRNRRILSEYRAGKTYRQLAEEYDVSRVRVVQIIQHCKELERRKHIVIPEIEQACIDFNASDGMHLRIINALHELRLDEHGRWRKLSKSEMLSIRNIGEQAANILIHAQEIANVN